MVQLHCLMQMPQRSNPLCFSLFQIFHERNPTQVILQDHRPFFPYWSSYLCQQRYWTNTISHCGNLLYAMTKVAFLASRIDFGEGYKHQFENPSRIPLPCFNACLLSTRKTKNICTRWIPRKEQSDKGLLIGELKF